MHAVYCCGMNAPVIQIRIKEALKERGRSLYWLAKHSGIPYNTLMRIKDARTTSIDFRVLDAICTTLECTPSDVIEWTPDKKKRGD